MFEIHFRNVRNGGIIVFVWPGQGKAKAQPTPITNFPPQPPLQVKYKAKFWYAV